MISKKVKSKYHKVKKTDENTLTISFDGRIPKCGLKQEVLVTLKTDDIISNSITGNRLGYRDIVVGRGFVSELKNNEALIKFTQKDNNVNISSRSQVAVKLIDPSTKRLSKIY